MGNHYIPQYYLKNFTESDNTDTLWAFQKGNPISFNPTIHNIANENDLYPHEVEEYLANEIEYPATNIIEKIKRGEMLSIEDKVTFSKYMIVMWKRVPKQREWARSRTPSIVRDVFDDTEKQLKILLHKFPEKSELLEERRRQLEILREEKGRDYSLMIWLGNLNADEKNRSVEVLNQMVWRFLEINGPEFFITGDNPVFFFHWLGIGNIKSELTFPITKRIALHASWNPGDEGKHFNINKQIIKEINRRTASNSLKYLYSPKNENWIHTIQNRDKYRFTRITYQN